MPIDDWVKLDLVEKIEVLIVELSLQIVFYICKAAIIVRFSCISLQRHLDMVFEIIDCKY